jgi:hypothetical protein
MSKTTRRDFAKTLSAAAGFIAADLHADTPPPVPASANAQAELVRAEFGQFLAGDDIDKVRKDFADSAPFLQKFRDVKLANGNEPDLTFSALAKR